MSVHFVQLCSAFDLSTLDLYEQTNSEIKKNQCVSNHATFEKTNHYAFTDCH